MVYAVYRGWEKCLCVSETGIGGERRKEEREREGRGGECSGSHQSVLGVHVPVFGLCSMYLFDSRGLVVGLQCNPYRGR